MKRLLSLSLSILFCALFALAQGPDGKLRIIAIGAHPDDCDIKFGGTAAMFAKLGHHVKFVSVTNGDAGHHEMGGGPLAVRRFKETQEAARRLGIAEYEVLPNHDGELMPTLANRHEIIRVIRRWNADIVIAHRTNDYHPDHRYAAMLVQDAAYMVIVPNSASDTPPLKKNPVFLYFQDNFQRPNPFRPDIAVAIDDVIETKLDGMDAHDSQFYEWLPWTAGRLAEVPKDPKARRQWLAKTRFSGGINPAVRATLERLYGKDRAAKVQHAEAFELCEYGRQPSPEELKAMFPFFP
ncbi:MAG: PIG-L family deacetylase [Bryobacterales bacterium]|nr:PIG-L family deacetylase [Bryobacterales bacterium]